MGDITYYTYSPVIKIKYKIESEMRLTKIELFLLAIIKSFQDLKLEENNKKTVANIIKQYFKYEHSEELVNTVIDTLLEKKVISLRRDDFQYIVRIANCYYLNEIVINGDIDEVYNINIIEKELLIKINFNGEQSEYEEIRSVDICDLNVITRHKKIKNKIQKSFSNFLSKKYNNLFIKNIFLDISLCAGKFKNKITI